MRYVSHYLVFIIATTSLLATTPSEAREMIYRHEVAHPPGYNTGTGRFVDEDRFLALEVDAFTPAKASLQSGGGHKVQEWGAELQFNFKYFAIGPEFWFGHYDKAGQGGGGADLMPTESYEILYNRYQLMVTGFSQPKRMQGWYAKGGYSYTKIDTETNTNRTEADSGLAYINSDETRHGLAVAGGHRFTFFQNRCSLNMGISYTKTGSRDVTQRSSDNRYASILANAGDKRLAVKDFPEMRLAVGLLF